MTNALFPYFKEQILQAGLNMSTLTIKAALARTAGWTYTSTASMLSNITSTARHAQKTNALAGKTFTAGVFDSSDCTFSTISSDSNAYNVLLLYNETTTETTSNLIAYYDTGVTGFPVTPNGGDINVTVNASGWFSL